MKSVILDVDTGIDDAMAIVYAARSPELELVGLTTCFGNIPVQDATRNSLLMLEKLGVQAPVAEGAAVTFRRGEKEDYARHVHGQDGLGGIVDKEPAGHKADVSAADFIIEQVKKRPHELTIIAVGPLTNIALALEKAPEIVPLIAELVIMGGAVYVRGNVSPYAEANIKSDPEAAKYVLHSGVKTTLVGLDVTMKTLLPHAQLEHWRASDNPLGPYLAQMTDFYMACYEGFQPGIGGCPLHDPLAVGIAIDSSFAQYEDVQVDVVTEGEKDGQTVANPEGTTKIRVCVGVENERFLDHFLNRMV